MSTVASNRTRLARLLTRELEGEAHFDSFTRGRYSTDASFYQITPVGVVVPKTQADIVRTIQIAALEGVSITARGAGTSQCGQAIGAGLIVDTSKYLNRILHVDGDKSRVTVEPGVVLDHMNATLQPDQLFFPVDPATANRATIGGMVGNNSAGSRSIRYGLTVDHVHAVQAVLSDGSRARFGPVPADLNLLRDNPGDVLSQTYLDLVRAVRTLYVNEQDEIRARLPRVLRHVAGYNLHRLGPGEHNMAHLLVGSEGTLAFSTELTLDLAAIPTHQMLGVCQFPTLHAAAAATEHIVTLDPAAVELMDRTLLDLARQNRQFGEIVPRFVRPDTDALLLVEFAGPDIAKTQRGLNQLDDLMGTLGFPDSVVRADTRAFQQQIWSVRKAGLNIVMSMKGDGKPVSFIEDCAVPLEHLAEYTDRINEIFRKHNTSGTWYAHASVGCLHVRPVLNLKLSDDVRAMRAIADETHEVVRHFKGSHSGEHGDGLLRSEFLAPMFGERIVRALGEVKRRFDPIGLFNPGKIVDPPPMDDRSVFRYPPGYHVEDADATFDWAEWGGWGGAVEMCNNNGACRKTQLDVMCPSYRVTGDEIHTTRGRANALRLAMSGQLGPAALWSDAMYDAMELCVGCKACRRECPTGIDMARMKTEFLRGYNDRNGLRLRDRVVAYLPRYAPFAARMAGLANTTNRVRTLARLTQRVFGLTNQRPLPAWRHDSFRDTPRAPAMDARSVVLFVDTFNRYYEPENVHDAVAVLKRAGYGVITPRAADSSRPLCCGRTFLNAGLLEEAQKEARRTLDALRPYVDKGRPIVGLEPSCLLTFRDEFTAILPGPETRALAEKSLLLEEFLATEQNGGRLNLALSSIQTRRAVLHGHCHQKAFGGMPAVETVLGWIPELRVEPIESSCCGMAGSFGYEAEHFDISMQMAELTLLPTIRQAPDATVVADGTSCRKQIADATGREAVHVVRLLAEALALRAHE